MWKRLKLRYKILALIVTLIGVSSLYERQMREYESDSIQPIGELIEINAKDIHIYASGRGNKTLIFMAGSGTPCAYTDFFYLQTQLSPMAKTFSYDAPGFGWSEHSERSRDIDTIVAELHQLLADSNQAPPYILVAHSLSSLEGIRYAQLYPEEVEGIIFLDGGSPEYYLEMSETSAVVTNRLFSVLRVTGINRLLGITGFKPPLLGEDIRSVALPDDVKATDEVMYNHMLGNKNNLDLIKNINENAKIVLDDSYIEGIPILVLSSDSGEKWGAVQKALLNWSDINEHIVMKDGRHYLHWSNKEEVLSEIKAFIGGNE